MPSNSVIGKGCSVSARRTSAEIEDYDATVGPTRRMVMGGDGEQPGSSVTEAVTRRLRPTPTRTTWPCMAVVLDVTVDGRAAGRGTLRRAGGISGRDCRPLGRGCPGVVSRSPRSRCRCVPAGRPVRRRCPARTPRPGWISPDIRSGHPCRPVSMLSNSAGEQPIPMPPTVPVAIAPVGNSSSSTSVFPVLPASRVAAVLCRCPVGGIRGRTRRAKR